MPWLQVTLGMLAGDFTGARCVAIQWRCSKAATAMLSADIMCSRGPRSSW